MSRTVIFGAGGRAGRTAVTEALARGHDVTAVVREVSRYDGPSGARVVRGDVLAAADRRRHPADGHRRLSAGVA